MKPPHALSVLIYIVWFLTIPLLGPDGTFPMCLEKGKPVECEKWKVLAKFEKYDDCFKAQMEARSRGLEASHDIPSSARQVENLRAACLRDGDPRLLAK
jgi:hypothetical protein